ncbi:MULTISPECIES: glycosyltransferase family 4 protein [Chryseobacterium]|uniref:glycosyltransferase family 4 protein n=1 Tax=Chryseobacterium TaxID=59732 RepID=UPI001294BCF1|nr:MULTISPECIES: glycosyltransferase family 4 protein [Chryseobacterium]MDR6923463.1 glycosyltransferase involved in cell wall biosynthesis [Chryseobacterium sp. 2987]
MHIMFLLPGHGKKPIGGHKIIYEYANYFVKEGHEVSIVYGSSCLFGKESFKNKIKSLARYIYFKTIGDFRPYGWFDLDRSIKLYFNWNLEERRILKADKYICTSIETAYYLNEFKCKNSDKIYFIQGYENWKWGNDMVHETWKFNMKKVTISEWLMELIKKNNEIVYLVENGFDFNVFDLDVPVESRQNTNVLMLYHTSPNKGVANGFKSLDLVKKEIPELQVNLFGTFPKPVNLPTGYNYYRIPEKEKLRMLYNDAAIFVGTSIEEGWGLTVGEAMQCGCAIVCTDNKGYQAMAIDNSTAKVSPAGDIKSMADNIIELIKNSETRYSIAQKGYEHIKKFDNAEAFSKFKKILNDD